MTVFTFADLAFLANAQDPLYSASGIYPSVDFPFARNKSLTEVISGQSLLTYGLNSSATFVGSDGLIQTAGNDIPRFEHNPLTLESLGVLVEQQSANLLLRSEEFNEAVWTKTRSSVTQNAAVAPDGATTADKLIEDTTTTSSHTTSQASIAYASGTAYAFSLFGKAVERQSMRLSLPAAAFGATLAGHFNLLNGNINSTSAGATTRVQQFPSDWWRAAVSATATASATSSVTVFLGETATGTNISYTGNGLSGINPWGAQLEEGIVTSYIPTTNAAATRQATLIDLADAARAGAIRSFYAEFRSPASGVRGVVSLNDGTANERISLCTDGANVRLIVHDGGVEQCNIIGGTTTAGALCRVACRVGANDFAISVNGAAVVADTSGTLPTVDRIMPGRTQAGEYLNGPLGRFTGWTESLSDAALRALAA